MRLSAALALLLVHRFCFSEGLPEFPTLGVPEARQQRAPSAPRPAPVLSPLSSAPQTGFHAALTIRKSKEDGCRAVKVGPKLFLTAAHCPFLAPWKSNDRVMLVTVTGRALQAKIRRIFFHPQFEFDPTQVPDMEAPPDLALIELYIKTPDIPQAKLASRLPEHGAKLWSYGYDCGQASGVDKNLYMNTRFSQGILKGHNDTHLSLKHRGCLGDSGSPLYNDEGEVLSIMSSALSYDIDPPNPEIFESIIYSRVDAGATRQWLDAMLKSARRGHR